MILGIDKFDGKYTKVIGDYNLKMSTVYFDYARIQKVDDNFYWLLCYATTVANVEFKYKPTEQRFPGYAAILLKKADYLVNLKNKDGNYESITFKPTPMESWLIAHFEYHQDMFFNPNQAFSGFLNLSANTFDALPPKTPNAPVNSTGIMNVSLVDTTPFNNLPDCELHQPGSKGSKKTSKSKKVGLSQEVITDLYWETMKESDLAYLALQEKNPLHLDEKDRDNIRLGLFLHSLGSI